MIAKNSTFNVLESYILSDGLDDWVMLGAIAEAAVAFGIAASVLESRNSVVDAVRNLYLQGLINVGDVHSRSGFHAWEGTSSGTIERLQKFISIDDLNAWYAAAWICLTEQGILIAEQIEGI